MKFNFKIQDYQTSAVDSVVSVFQGQTFSDGSRYVRDLGEKSIVPTHVSLNFNKKDARPYFGDDFDTGFKNEDINISDSQLLENIKAIQQNNNIEVSHTLLGNLGRCSLDVEMETGTGKTYVYIKTMFELNKRYGWSKFIVVVPSLAIREGVKKSFEMTTDHFMEHYGKKARFFIYNSNNLNQLDSFSASSGINVMIINKHAFAKSFKKDAKKGDSLIIYSKRDEFGSRRPIDVIAANRPIIIMDEPQELEGKVTQESLFNFNPLFSINYSATHKTKHNCVYALDALDAYNEKLVKKIEVKGIEVKNLRGTDSYAYLEEIVLSANKPPRAKIEIEISYNKSINRETRIFDVGDDLHHASKEMNQYKDYVISDIDPKLGVVEFTNGEKLKTGELTGDSTALNMRRIQIREAILSHFEKEKNLFDRGIKCLTLFFIDEVCKYREYDEDGNALLGEYGRIFEQEYKNILEDFKKSARPESDYKKYLDSMCSDETSVHTGYFSIDKKGKNKGRLVDSKGDKDIDISTYDLIMKNKERLLSFEEPTRFIFSHSALSEGWDNPNVFQICTLKHSDSSIKKRQEVGRGLRLCVDKFGNRMDWQVLGDSIFDVNTLTVIASESYKNFVADLQKETNEELRNRPSKFSVDAIIGKSITDNFGNSKIIDSSMAHAVQFHLIKNDYIDEEGKSTATYKQDKDAGCLAKFTKEDLEPYAADLYRLFDNLFENNSIDDMISDGRDAKYKENDLNDNFYKSDFQELWKDINHKYIYTVSFNSNELIDKAIRSINDELFVTQVKYTTTTGHQLEDINENDIRSGNSFAVGDTRTEILSNSTTTSIRYDLIGDVAKGTNLTRKTASAILKGLHPTKLEMFKNNPEEFISKVTKYINDQKATMIVEHISYDAYDEEYDSSIFTAEKTTESFEKAYRATKAIQNFVFTDGSAEESIERKFAEDLDAASEVSVYAKLPRSFKIPTPVGDYAPDWAIAFHKGTVKHIFFIAETKGSMNTLELRSVEHAKIACAKKLFNEMSFSNVRYHEVDNYQSLLDVMTSIE